MIFKISFSHSHRGQHQQVAGLRLHDATARVSLGGPSPARTGQSPAQAYQILSAAAPHCTRAQHRADGIAVMKTYCFFFSLKYVYRSVENLTIEKKQLDSINHASLECEFVTLYYQLRTNRDDTFLSSRVAISDSLFSCQGKCLFIFTSRFAKT